MLAEHRSYGKRIVTRGRYIAGNALLGTAGIITTDNNGNFTVSGNHTYTQGGTFYPDITITEGNATADAYGEADVAGLAVSEQDFSTPEGSGFSGGVATFTDTGPNASAVPGNYLATVAWGDGCTSSSLDSTAVTITADTNDDGGFTVTGNHTYSSAGTPTATVTVTNLADQSTGNVSDSVNVTSVSGTVEPIGGAQGQPFSGNVAIFSDLNLGTLAGNYTASIDWGDGNYGNGTITGNDTVGFTVSGNNTFAAAGNLTVTVYITDPSGATATVTGYANVTGIVPSSVTNNATVNQSVTEALATFTDSAPVASGYTAGNYTATVDWGDGSGPATATVAGNASVGYTVSANYTFTAVGTVNPTIAIQCTDGRSASITAEVDVAVGTVTATAVPVTCSQTPSFSGTLATFTDTDPDAAVGDFTANIAWGDGNSATGNITANGNGGFDVNGSYTYAAAASYEASVTITANDGQTATVAELVNVTTVAGVAQAITAAQGQTYSGNVATFTDLNSGTTADEYSAIIVWGDGNTGNGTITGNDTVGFTVSGNNTFGVAGTFNPTVFITDPTGAITTLVAPVNAAGPQVQPDGSMIVTGNLVAPTFSLVTEGLSSVTNTGAYGILEIGDTDSRCTGMEIEEESPTDDNFRCIGTLPRQSDFTFPVGVVPGQVYQFRARAVAPGLGLASTYAGPVTVYVPLPGNASSGNTSSPTLLAPWDVGVPTKPADGWVSFQMNPSYYPVVGAWVTATIADDPYNLWGGERQPGDIQYLGNGTYQAVLNPLAGDIFPGGTVNLQVQLYVPMAGNYSAPSQPGSYTFPGTRMQKPQDFQVKSNIGGSYQYSASWSESDRCDYSVVYEILPGQEKPITVATTSGNSTSVQFNASDPPGATFVAVAWQSNTGQSSWFFPFTWTTPSPYSNSTTVNAVQPKPAAPVNIHAAEDVGADTQNDAVFNVEWQNTSNNEKSFLLERSLDGGKTWISVTTEGADTAQYQDKVPFSDFGNRAMCACPFAPTVTYRVTAVNSQGSSTPTVAATAAEKLIPQYIGDLKSLAGIWSVLQLKLASTFLTYFANGGGTQGPFDMVKKGLNQTLKGEILASLAFDAELVSQLSATIGQTQAGTPVSGELALNYGIDSIDLALAFEHLGLFYIGAASYAGCSSGYMYNYNLAFAVHKNWNWHPANRNHQWLTNLPAGLGQIPAEATSLERWKICTSFDIVKGGFTNQSFVIFPR